MNELEKFDFSDIFPSEQSEFVRFDDVKDMISQTQLTIPQSIADMADKEFKWLKDDVLGFGYSFIEYGCESPELRLWVTNGDCWDIEAGKRANILSAYLAGKALGVDLVKVVEG